MSSKFSYMRKLLIPLLLFFFTLSIYIHNLSRSVYGGDTGDFISASVVMGVPHPPGYPLFTLIGFLLTRINIFTPAFMVGLIASFSSALAIVMFYLISLKLTKNALASFISSLVLAFNFIFWFYAEIAEVFSLNVLFVLILIFLAILFSEKKKKMYFFVLSFFVGLSLTNHQTIILIFPAILMICFSEFIKLIKIPKNLLLSLLFFALGFCVYLYVPIASFHNPPVNWIKVDDLDSFLRLILRRDYGTFNAGPFPPADLFERIAVLKIFFGNLIAQLTIPSALLILAGLIYSFKKNKKIFVAILLGFLLSGPLFIGYASFPLLSAFFIGVNERFMLMSLVVILLFLPFGLMATGEITNKIFRKKTYEKLFIGIFILIPISLFYYNFPKTDLSNITAGDDFAYDYMSFLPNNSLLLIGGDTPLLNTWYIHYALNYRKDVKLMNLNTLKEEDYYNQQKQEYLKNNPKDLSSPNLKLRVFEYIAQKRPVYASEPIKPVGKFEKISWVPYGLVSRLFLEKEALPKESRYFSQTAYIWDNLKYFKNLKKQEKYLSLRSAGISDISSQYANSLLLTGNYVLSQYNNKNSALAFFTSAQKTSPGYYRNYLILGIYYFSEKECYQARDNFKKGIETYPFDKDLYFFLYSSYNNCLSDKKSAQKTTQEYKKVFGTDFFKDLQEDIENSK